MSELNLSYGICHSSVAPMRAEPTHRAEMISQILFGERFSIKEIDEISHKWIYVENAWDGYRGWIHSGHVTLINHSEFLKPTKYLSAHHHDRLLMNGQSAMVMPLGADLFHMKKKSFDWYFQNATYKGKKIKCLKNAIFQADRQLIVQHAQQFLGAPYLWGGRTVLGIDCSGLSQMAYKLANISLPRDASQQVEIGETVDFIEQSLPGDLAFFDNEDGQIVHVGIMMNQETIIHGTESSGGVVIDSIDNGGIISQKLKKRTHQLRIIKRILPY